MTLQLPLTRYQAGRFDLRKDCAFEIANEPELDIYSRPAPPRSFLFAGAGWAYGVGCGVGTFFGVGVGVGLQPFFGAGLGAGAFCGAGFAAGFILGNGTPYIHYGASTPFFYAPRFLWAERKVVKYKRLLQQENRRKQRAAFFSRIQGLLSDFVERIRKLRTWNSSRLMLEQPQ